MVETAAQSASERAMHQFRQPLIEYLVSSLEVDDKWVRIMALEMLGMIGDARSAGHVQPLLADRDRDLRTAAAKSLALLCSAEGTPGRLPSDNCGDCMIRLLASEALEQLKAGR